MGRRPDLVRLKEQLGLSDAQTGQLRSAWTEQAKAHIRRRADVAIGRLELRQLLEAQTVDEKAVAAKAKELGDLEASAVRARVDGFMAMRKVLTPEQQQKLRELPRPRRLEREREGRRRGDRGAALSPSGDDEVPGAMRDEQPSADGEALTADEAR